MAVALVACQEGNKERVPTLEEDLQAKKMMQGIWLDADDDAPSFRVKGDSIFYPDTTSQPVRFWIAADTFYIEGAFKTSYPIVKQSEQVLQFKDQSGEVVHLLKSNDIEDIHYFDHCSTVVLNQRQTIKRDTVFFAANERYHTYVQVNPTKQKVIKPSINDDGMEVENVYYDNSIRFILFHGAQRVYQHDFHREDFKRLVPEEFLRQSVLSDLVFGSAGGDGVRYVAQLAIPDSFSSYEIEILVTYRGQMSMAVVAGTKEG